MLVKKAEFVISAVKPAQYPEDALPEIALAGRSNVGKSSLINCLIQRKNLARTSSKPGKTQTINFYRINDQLYFADVPGYGFARVPKSVRLSWGKMMETYLTGRETLKGVIQVVDLRHPPTADDQNMYQYLKHFGIPVIVVATKADKISRGKWQKHLKAVREGLELHQGDPLLLFSSETAYGKEQLWKEIEKCTGNSEGS
ncbi:ribosome biogenesis GTP-binding protein YihA/YsxC [Thermoactinomyces sp. CICC 10523]|uniref:ribosome biogenesis GTP-binding protein YihA/YsxC n=1 Tax=Thermoactinomyces sp. CICC 10523 TaxID=2767428 RepID=UPI0018DD3F43|nr:ribosome biogenesis GTP-binding protein YihA/YsxC [Thermoactinomyces sp. CICC 10523]MBH8596893.1 YihA family ribosome biogenesis GTP-binding protein [Thermoactinomyces sp. CICC 10523]